MSGNIAISMCGVADRFDKSKECPEISLFQESPVSADPSMSPRGRLSSWKEIASYLGVSVATAQRWEGELGLPVHRLGKRRRVFAYTDEIDPWQSGKEGKIRASRTQYTAEGGVE